MASRITGYTDTDTNQNQQFAYDALDRLTDVSGNAPASYAYDADGNRTSATLATGADLYTPATSSNRLASIAGLHPRTYSYDAAGHTIGDGVNTFLYDGRGRLKQATTPQGTTQYGVNGLGQRVSKPGRIFVYDEAGHLLGKYTSQGQVLQETVYLGETQVAVLQGGTPFFVYSDHLNAPRTIIDASNTVVWRWDSEPFGTAQPTGSFFYYLRYPGQYFDSETGLNYNMARDYDPLTGRYIESDPIGLAGGLNTYGYVGGNPVKYTDRRGLVFSFPALPDKRSSDLMCPVNNSSDNVIRVADNTAQNSGVKAVAGLGATLGTANPEAIPFVPGAMTGTMAIAPRAIEMGQQTEQSITNSEAAANSLFGQTEQNQGAIVDQQLSKVHMNNQ